MKLKDFLHHKTQCYELCIIIDNGWRVASCWIDDEDLFVIPPQYANKEVKSDKWGLLSITIENGIKQKIPCHYIEVG